MKKLSFKNLPEVKDIKIEEDFRFGFPQGRAKFLIRALYDKLFTSLKTNIY